MIYIVRIIIFCIIFFNISAMQLQNEQDHMAILLHHLVQPLKSNSIIIFPIKTTDFETGKAKRQKSEKLLSDIAFKGVTRCLQLMQNATAGKAFLIMNNCVADYEKEPAHSRGFWFKEIEGTVIQQEIDYASANCEISFIVYNMPYYKHNEGCFNWAYGESLDDILYDGKKPCLVLVDEDIYNSVDTLDEIYRKFHGNKKVFVYEKDSQGLREYKSSFLGDISCPMIALWVAVIAAGLFYITSSGLIATFNINF